jgi:hypothetical protein
MNRTDLQILETGENRVHSRPDAGRVWLDVVLGNVFRDLRYKVFEPLLGLGVGWDDLFTDKFECLFINILTEITGRRRT